MEIPIVYRPIPRSPAAAGAGRAPAQPAPNQELTLTCREDAQYAESFSEAASLVITLNGEAHELDGPLSVADLLATLSIDPRRVAVEYNYAILKRPLFGDTIVHEGDRIEIVNFVGGG